MKIKKINGEWHLIGLYGISLLSADSHKELNQLMKQYGMK